MSEYYVLQDLSSWDINKGYFKEEGTTLSELVDYDEYTNRHRAAKLVILSPLWFIWAVVLIVNFCKNIFYDLRKG